MNRSWKPAAERVIATSSPVYITSVNVFSLSPRPGFMDLDLPSAGALMLAAELMSPCDRARFERFPVERALRYAWSVLA